MFKQHDHRDQQELPELSRLWRQQRVPGRLSLQTTDLQIRSGLCFSHWRLRQCQNGRHLPHFWREKFPIISGVLSLVLIISYLGQFEDGRMVYTNYLRAYPSSDGEITRQDHLKLLVGCKMDQDSVSQIMFRIEHHDDSSITGSGRYTTLMHFYTSSTFTYQVWKSRVHPLFEDRSFLIVFHRVLIFDFFFQPLAHSGYSSSIWSHAQPGIVCSSGDGEQRQIFGSFHWHLRGFTFTPRLPNQSLLPGSQWVRMKLKRMFKSNALNRYTGRTSMFNDSLFCEKCFILNDWMEAAGGKGRM